MTVRRRHTTPVVAALGTLLAASACGVADGVRTATPAPSTAGPATARVSPPADPAMASAPYLYLGGDNPPDPTAVMRATGVRWFTLAFVLSRGRCDPQWDGTRPLVGGADQGAITAIRDAGGDVIASFGGKDGPWLEESCGTPGQLAAAYQRVIDAYRLKAIDIDVEGTVYDSPVLQQRIIDALKIVKAADPGLTVDVTFPIAASGPDSTMVNRAAAAGLPVDGWTAMPFDMDAAGQNMGNLTQQLIDRLATVVAAAYRYSQEQAFRHVGISSMNGITDAHETVTEADFRAMLAYARRRHLARLTFWSINRDRSCAAGVSAGDTCSGIRQSDWAFTRIMAGYRA
ncbi:chitinase [Dactylosporangium sp. NPDC051484]|uniref:chitinase n=1 Tax=Dactylosporangium sp. NPDC051484 TaxID=3154942 RepID=UPI00344BBAEA